MSRELNIFLACPTYSGVLTTGFHNSSLLTWQACNTATVDISEAHCSEDGLINRARTQLLGAFIEMPACTHIMWIDSDIEWNPADVLRLVCADKPIVCGVYRKRTDSAFTFPVVLLEDTPDLIPLDEKGCFEIKYGPGGFMLMRRDAIMRMIAFYPERRCMIRDGGWFADANAFAYDFFPTLIDDDGVMLSEDYGFCKLARAAGLQVWCIPDIALRHKGGKNFDGCLMDGLTFKMPESKKDPIVEAAAAESRMDMDRMRTNAEGLMQALTWRGRQRT